MAATPRPWRYKNRNWRNELDPHNFYITGDHCEDEYGTVSTSVAIVCGNETARTIPEDNARLIVRAVNLHDGLVAACEYVADMLSQPVKEGATEVTLSQRLAALGGLRAAKLVTDVLARAKEQP